MTATATSFGEWLLAYEGEDDPIADLRDDYGSDYRVMRKRRGLGHIETPSVMETNMRMQGACREAIEALREAAVLYGQPLVNEDDDELEEDY